MEHDWLVVFLVSVDIQDTNNQEINKRVKEILTDRFNLEIFEKLKGVIVDERIKLILVNNVKLISRTGIDYNTESFELTNDHLSKLEMTLPDAFQLQDKESLEFLLKHLQSTFSSKRVMISTYGHGSMFGIFSSKNFIHDNGLTNYVKVDISDISYWNTVSPTLMEKASFDSDNEKIDYLIAARPFSSDKYSYKKWKALEYHEIIVTPTTPGSFEKFKTLTNEEFAAAIKASFGKVDFLIFNNCVMQNIYTQHSFQKTVDYLVAPATGIVYPCFNVRGIIGFLMANPSAENPSVAKYIAESFKENQNPDYPKYKELIEEFIVVSMRLNSSSKIFEVLKQLKDYLKEVLEGPDKADFACAISNSLDETYPMEYNTFTGETIFDLVQLLESDYFKNYNQLQLFKEKIKSLIEADKDFIFSFIGKTAYKAGYKTYYKSKPDIPVSGICIYFPKNKKQNEVIRPYFNSISYQNDLEKGLRWYNDIIMAYLNIMRS
ncbi:MAG: clostripain-related cysteine peptidase [Ferruginibacter sp.]